MGIYTFTESVYENAILELFTERLGYQYLIEPPARDYRIPILEETLEQALVEINSTMPLEAIEEAIRKLRDFEHGSIAQKNMQLMDYIQSGIQVKFYIDGKEQHDLVRVIDFGKIEKNYFFVANQWTFVENSEKRPDILLFINGLPLVLIELKSPSREHTDASEAYRQIRNYMHEIPTMFAYNAMCVMSDQFTSKVGTITASEDWFMEWKTIDGSYENTQYASFDTFFEGIFEKQRLLDIIQNFICFSKQNGGNDKILAGYHQYHAVRKAIKSTIHAASTDGKGGVFWHTQGSGKSLSMVFFAHLLQSAMDSPTIVVITDRNDLDSQLHNQFSKCKDFLRQDPQQAESREHLKQLLTDRQANGIIFTTMQKFEEADEPMSQRRNIVVIADEAHRGQYGLEEKVNAETGKVTIGTARIIRDNLPGATFIGFTGTPISSKDRNTREIFGNYIDVYDMTQAVEDGATRPVYYESRVIHLKLDQNVLDEIDKKYDLMAEYADDIAVEKSKRELGQMESILGAPETIEALVNDIISHYENNRQDILTGKAMIVAYSRSIAMKIYKAILEKRSGWNEKVAVVMTSGNNDPEEWRKVIGNKQHKTLLATNFKDDKNPLKIAIVVDMWLTGFDVPSLATMYVYKPMSGHNLMQAIARVNRVFQDKEGGLVVDYVGIASALKQAMSDYTARDKQQFGDPDIGKTAYPKFLEKLEVCRDLLHGFDYTKFQTGTDLERAKAITGGVNFMADPKRLEDKDRFIKEALLLHQALTLCRSMIKSNDRFEAAFFEAVRTMLIRLAETSGKSSWKEINFQINELLKQSVQSEGVINLFADVEFSIFDEKFLEEIGRMKEKNLAVEILKKLLLEKVRLYKRTNLVKSEKFSELLARIMNAYINGQLTNEEVIEELLKMAQEMAAYSAEESGLGLNDEEMAFYDALTKPSAVKDFYANEELVAITKELTEQLRANRTIDWQKKESARAAMRLMVKKLLKRHKYPPEGMDDAIVTVLRQCEMWTETP